MNAIFAHIKLDTRDESHKLLDVVNILNPSITTDDETLKKLQTIALRAFKREAKIDNARIDVNTICIITNMHTRKQAQKSIMDYLERHPDNKLKISINEPLFNAYTKHTHPCALLTAFFQCISRLLDGERRGELKDLDSEVLPTLIGGLQK